jgi:Domain of unknown function (DUF4864)
MRIIALVFTLLFLLGSQVHAGDDVAAAQSVIRSQAEAFARDDAAYAFAAPEIHELYPKADAFLGMVQHGYAPVYRHKSFEFGEARAVDGKIAQQVHIIDADGVPWDALYTLEQQRDGSLKILGCALIKTGEGV